MQSDKKLAKRSNQAIRDLSDRIDRLMEFVTDDVILEMITIQCDLARNATREPTRQRASAKVIDYRTDLMAMKAKLAVGDEDDEDDSRIKVLVVGSGDVEQAAAVAQLEYLQRLKGQQ